jgi:hypothetical protein
MNIFIFHRIPFEKVRYDQIIDHHLHDVTYYCRTQEQADQLCSEIGPDIPFKVITEGIEETISATERIIALSEYDLIEAARWRERYKIQGPKTKSTHLVRDKIAMKQAVRRAELRVPRFLSVLEFESMSEENCENWIHGTSVLKPRAGASSEGVHVVRGFKALKAAVAKTQRPNDFELEEFIDAPVVHFDGFVRDGTLGLLQASRYVGSCFEFTRGVPLGSYQVNQVSPDDQGWIRQVLSALEITHGSFHIEAFDMRGELIFLEAANRCGGADVVPNFLRKWGINLYFEHIRALIGPDLCQSRSKIESGPSPDNYGWFLVPPSLNLCSDFVDRLKSKAQGRRCGIVEWRTTAICPNKIQTKVSYKPQDLPFSAIFSEAIPGEMGCLMNELMPLCRT